MKTKSVIKNYLLLFVASTSLLFYACKKNDVSTESSSAKALTVHLSDDPSQYDAVFIDIKTVEVKIDTNTQHDGNFDNDDRDEDNDHHDHDQFGKWDTLSIRSGVYDVMKFRNGLDTVLGKANIPNSRIEKIRITLGDNNTVVVNKVSHPLLLSPGSSHYAYAKVNQEEVDESNGNNEDLFIDFDLAESIRERDGNYYLRPFLKSYGDQKFGKIEGRVMPNDAHPLVKAVSGTNTYSAIPEDTRYRIRGLKAGTYNVTFTGSNGYKDTTINNVQVNVGNETKIPDITLHK